MAAADHLTEDRLPAATAVKAEPASTGLHVTRLDWVGVRVVAFEGLRHLCRVTQALILKTRARQNLIADEKEILVADLVILEKVLAVRNAAAYLEIVRRLHPAAHTQQTSRYTHAYQLHHSVVHTPSSKPFRTIRG